MKLFAGWVVSAGLVVSATAANAQMLAPNQIGSSPYTVVSDVGGPYAAMPPEAPARVTGRCCCRRGRSTRWCARADSRRLEFRINVVCSTRLPWSTTAARTAGW